MDKRIRDIFLIVIGGMCTAATLHAYPAAVGQPSDTSYFKKGEPDWNLVEAAIRKDPEAILYLLNEGADPDAKAEGGMTALMFAAENGDSLSIRILLLNGADPDLTYVEETTPLMVAVLNKHFTAAHLLLLGGADPDHKDVYGAAPLIYAAAMNEYPLADLLIFYGADRETADPYGNTPLMAAVALGNLETSDVLLQDGSNPDARDRDKNTPLMVAAQQGDTAMMALLLEYGAGKELVNKQHYTPLAHAVISEQFPAVQMLVDSGANVQVQIEPNMNLVELAARTGNKKIKEFLEAHGATATGRPDFSDIGIGWGNSFSGSELLMQARIWLSDSKHGLFAETGYDVRPILRKVQVQENDTLVMQYRESRSSWTHGIGKNFRITTDKAGISYGIYTALYGMLSFSRYRGIGQSPRPVYRLVPSAGLYLSSRIAGIKAGTERYSFGTIHEGKWKMNITLFVRIPINRTSYESKEIPY